MDLRLCIYKREATICLEYAHIAVDNLHLSPTQLLRCIERMGAY